MMGPDASYLGVSELGANFFDTLLEKGMDYLQKKAVAYTAPKSVSTPAMYAPAPAPAVVVRAVPVVTAPPPASSGIPTWGWIAIGVGAVALVGGGALLLARRS